MTDLPTDIRQVSVNRVTIGVIISTALLAGSISWSSSRLVSRLDAVEATVEAIQDSMDFQSYARVEDIDHLHRSDLRLGRSGRPRTGRVQAARHRETTRTSANC